jgi:hypothetical protein
MAVQKGYYDHLKIKNLAIGKTERNGKLRSRRMIIVIFITAMLLVSFVIMNSILVDQGGRPARTASQSILAVPLVYQCKDSAMNCIPCAGAIAYHNGAPRAWNCTKFGGLAPGIDPGDNAYGTPDDCPHCSVYCAPASMMMIATYRGVVTSQDSLYETGEIRSGSPGNGVINSHGVGMTDGTTGSPQEIQTSWIAIIGPLNQNDSWGLGNNPLTAVQMAKFINLGHPVMWVDHNGWPVNMSTTFPSSSKGLQGHVKVIIGYDDKGTIGDTSDDLCLINDPWPEYTDKSILPVGATVSSGGKFDPYWFSVSSTLGDPADIFITDTKPDIPEFSSLLLPIGFTIIAAVTMIWRRREGRE